MTEIVSFLQCLNRSIDFYKAQPDRDVQKALVVDPIVAGKVVCRPMKATDDMLHGVLPYFVSNKLGLVCERGVKHAITHCVDRQMSIRTTLIVRLPICHQVHLNLTTMKYAGACRF